MHSDARSLIVQYPSRRSVLTASRAEGAKMTLFVPSDVHVRVGETLTLDVQIASVPRQFVLSTRVAALGGARAGLAGTAGFTVTFEGPCKREAAEMIAICAGRAPAQGTSISARFMTRIKCHVRNGSNRLKGFIADFSSGGVFIAVPPTAKVQVGSEVQLLVEPGWFGFGGTCVAARVVWRGVKHGEKGIGVRFTEDSSRIQSLMRKHVTDRTPVHRVA